MTPRDDNGTSGKMGRIVRALVAAEEAAARVSGMQHGALSNLGRHLTDMMATLADFEDIGDEPPAPELPSASTESKFPPLSAKEGEKQCRRYYYREVGDTRGREAKRFVTTLLHTEPLTTFWRKRGYKNTNER